MVKTRVFTYKRKEKIEKIYGGKLVKVRAHLLGAKKKKKRGLWDPQISLP